MKAQGTVVSVIFVASGIISLAHAAGISDEMVKNAYKQVLTEADKNKDGKLSLAECKAMFKDNAKGEKNCSFWDANHDGIIPEDEYVSQVKSVQRKK
jgi:Ca2+-binding EF-hand superfamily protein